MERSLIPAATLTSRSEVFPRTATENAQLYFAARDSITGVMAFSIKLAGSDAGRGEKASDRIARVSGVIDGRAGKFALAPTCFQKIVIKKKKTNSK